MATIINMPRLSPTMEEGVLAKWTKKAGDKIAPGDVIAEVETDKANMDFPLEDEGVLLELLVAEGTTVKLGAPVAILGEAGEDTTELKKGLGGGAKAEKQAAKETKPAAKAEKPASKSEPESESESASASESKPAAKPAPAPATATAKVAAKAPAPKAEAPAPRDEGERIKASPLAKKIAAEKGVELAAIAGSGPGGRVVKRDVDAAQPAGAASASGAPFVARPTGEDRLVAPSMMRKTIAKRLVEAKQTVPHFYLSAEATVDRLLALRAELNELAETKISVNDLVVKALALALVRVPDANASWTAEGMLYHGSIDVGVAVSVPDGLITPQIRHADQKPLSVMSAEIKALAERAKQKKLKPEEYAPGSATVSNLGMFGISEFKAIINPPESVILAVGATTKKPIVVTQDGHDTIVIAQRMALSLSCDHRVVDGVLGAKLLGEIVKILEKPASFLL